MRDNGCEGVKGLIFVGVAIGAGLAFGAMDTSFRITPGGVPNDGLTFEDYSRRNRNGHTGHALVEYARDFPLAFHSNTSGASTTGARDGFGINYH